jgi:membrane-associated protease RseP (regulator of RpoE activity)
MQPEQPKPQAQPAPQQGSAPTPQRSPVGASATAGRSRPTKLIFGALVIAALGFGAVATGLVHIPGFDSGASAPQPTSPQATSMTQTAPDQVDEGDHTIGVRFSTLTPDVIKARQINTGRSTGIYFRDVFANSPAEKAGIRDNDVVVAIDGVPIQRMTDIITKIRLTPIGQSVAVTIERAGATQDASVTIGRCITREEPKGPVSPGLVTACRIWTN